MLLIQLIVNIYYQEYIDITGIIEDLFSDVHSKPQHFMIFLGLVDAIHLQYIAHFPYVID